MCGNKRAGEVKEILGREMKRGSWQFQGRKMHTMPRVKIILKRKRGGLKMKNKTHKAVSKEMR